MLSVQTDPVSICPGGSGIVEVGLSDTNPDCNISIHATIETADPGAAVYFNFIPSNISAQFNSSEIFQYVIRVNVTSDTPPGSYLLNLTANRNDICTNDCLSDTVTINVGQFVDLDADSNNDGLIDTDNSAMGTDDPIEMDFPGKWMWINSNDSDGDGLADNTDAIINESQDEQEDVVDIWVQPIDLSQFPADVKLFLEISDPSRVRVFDGRFAFSPAILGPGLPSPWEIVGTIPEKAGRSFGVEGLAAGSVVLSLVLRDASMAEICRDEVMLTVVELEVKWYTWDSVAMLPANEITDPNMPHLDDPATPQNESLSPANVGLRSFPGATAPGGGWKQDVGVAVFSNPPVDGLPITFRVFDVDDPSDNVAPVDDNDVTGPTGGDNRDTDASMGSGTFFGSNGAVCNTETTGLGVGTCAPNLTLSRQPGDNFRVAVTLKYAALDRLTDQFVPPGPPPPTMYQVPANDDQLPLFTGTLTRLMTVWRKLHVERDTMAAPGSAALQVKGLVGVITPNAPAPGQAQIDLGQNLPDGFDDQNLFEEGEIVFTACPLGMDTFGVIDSTGATMGNDFITILGVPGACATGSFYILRDDDDPSVLGTVQAPHFPDGGQLITDAFAAAYILPVYATGFQNVVPFQVHLSASDVDFGVGTWNDSLTIQSLPSFWACRVVGAWEMHGFFDDDGDPDNCFSLTPPFVPRPGAETPTTGATDSPEGTSVVFLQSISDDAACVGVTDEAHTVTHEVGHTCGSECGNDLHMHGMIMQGGAPNNQHRFAPETIAIFRSQDPW